MLGPAATADEALKLLQQERPTVAVLDLMLRRGFQLQSPKHFLSDASFIVSSGCEDPVAMGGQAFQGIANVRKPSTPKSLIAALEHAIANSA